MDFDTFKDELAKGVQERLEALYDRKYSVETHTVEKMNETYEAITVKPEDGEIGVNIKIDKLPSVKELSDEYGKVLAKKKAAYSEYKEVRKNMQTYQTAKYDIDKILGIEKTPDQNRTREQTR